MNNHGLCSDKKGDDRKIAKVDSFCAGLPGTISTIEPDRIIFIDLAKEKDVLRTIEEALKCEALSLKCKYP